MRMTRDGYSARSRSLSTGSAASLRGGDPMSEDASGIVGADVVGDAACGSTFGITEGVAEPDPARILNGGRGCWPLERIESTYMNNEVDCTPTHP